MRSLILIISYYHYEFYPNFTLIINSSWKTKLTQVEEVWAIEFDRLTQIKRSSFDLSHWIKSNGSQMPNLTQVIGEDPHPIELAYAIMFPFYFIL